jgi:bacteriocin biosynthesis cyclodehydratase domain-containing protein
MTSSFTTTRLKALLFQVIETGAGVILKRGVAQIAIDGKQSLDIVSEILRSIDDAGATPDAICARFAEPDRPAVRQLLQHLASRRFLVPADAPSTPEPETNADVFYWQFGRSSRQISNVLNKQPLVIVGLNRLARQMVAALNTVGVTNVELVDEPALRNVDLLDARGQWRPELWPELAAAPRPAEAWRVDAPSRQLTCVVATSDFGGQELLRPWNAFCVEHGLHFLPVLLQDMIGYLGPFVIPGETACLECLRARQNANLVDSSERRIAEQVAFEGQKVAAVHPAMVAILAETAAFELSRFYGGLPEWNVGKMIEVNLFATTMSSRKVFKAPRCPVCSPLNQSIPVNLRKPTPLPQR